MEMEMESCCRHEINGPRRLKEQIGGFGQRQPGWIVGCYLFLDYHYAVDCRD